MPLSPPQVVSKSVKRHALFLTSQIINWRLFSGYFKKIGRWIFLPKVAKELDMVQMINVVNRGFTKSVKKLSMLMI